MARIPRGDRSRCVLVLVARTPDDAARIGGWAIVALAGVVLGWRFFPRYYFFLLPVVVIAAARGFMLLEHLAACRSSPCCWSFRLSVSDRATRSLAADLVCRDASLIGPMLR